MLHYVQHDKKNVGTTIGRPPLRIELKRTDISPSGFLVHLRCPPE